MYDVIIIGGGVAGMTAAINCIRGGKTTLLLEGESIGGQIANSPKVENFPTEKEISGSELADEIFDHLSSLGGDFEFEKAVSVKKIDGIFKVEGEYNSYEGRAVIAALGVKHKHIGIENEKNLLGKGVYYCALCDGAFYKGREVALIGDGNTAMQYALLLSNLCSKVYLLTWFDKFFGDKVLEDAVRARENIKIMPETQTVDFVGKDKLEYVLAKDKKTGESMQIKVPAVFVAIGQIPDNKIFAEYADLDKQGYFITDESLSTKTEGLYVAGDCRVKKYRQVTTALSDGAVAAFSAVNYIDINK